MTWIAKAEAAGCEWLAQGETEQQAKDALVKAYHRAMKDWKWDTSLANTKTATFEDWYGIWAYDLSEAPVFCDGSPIKRATTRK